MHVLSLALLRKEVWTWLHYIWLLFHATVQLCGESISQTGAVIVLDSTVIMHFWRLKHDLKISIQWGWCYHQLWYILPFTLLLRSCNIVEWYRFLVLSRSLCNMLKLNTNMNWNTKILHSEVATTLVCNKAICFTGTKLNCARWYQSLVRLYLLLTCWSWSSKMSWSTMVK